ncbi:succinate--hydroxymethylglutarate CoA-transferase-like [Nylanderia fulva]|uniref:succinate--hydroxymethylglutarate CoA-transferase-like n=1 Tax=Nylanderia fulva TaxID=613905 RepID=UPI0010FBAD2A|nr:succinate--hydroxymethylglutarate CoA-transferase-like [Nylanderia fulva]XP_029171265.1 succinate--hydroxymethylglutarate CoA-transferase-like [Nylanderia fulva]XP_029171856.1 succinate--hydroxymethylglutarate CoA-transferase-like [Nylanderia fulva]
MIRNVFTGFSRKLAGERLLTSEYHLKKCEREFCQTNVKHDRSPLNGIRVLDLTRIVAGPYCTMILGDLGAEILKIERPGAGDESRKWGPPFFEGTQESTYFMSVNRNKKSVCIDLKRGKDIIYELTQTCDVLVENYVPGKLSSMGLGYEDIAKVAPHLIYCSMTGYGFKGPYANRPGYDVIAASLGGLLHITGSKDGPPCKVGVAMTDLAMGLYAHGAIMAALLQRREINQGQWIQCDLLSTQVASLINIASNYLNGNKEATRRGSEHESIVPYEAFPTKDGYMTVGAGSDLQFLELIKRLQLPELINNNKFKNNAARVKNRTELLQILRDAFKRKKNQDWSVIFEGASFPYGVVNTIKEVFDDPHVKHTKLIKELEHPVTGKVKLVGPPVTYSYATNRVRSSPPMLGQHTSEILRNILKYSDDKIEKLIAQKIVQ